MCIEVGGADVYCMAFNDAYLSDVQSLFTFLNQEEQHKANTFVKRSHRENYIRAHGYLRILLSKYFPTILPASWEFVSNAYGKPFVSPTHGVTLFFNLSHSKQYVAIIFHKTSDCGIDIEENAQMVIDEGMCQLVLSQKEQKMYDESKDKKQIFYQLWTLKEAYVKAVGSGLEHNPSEIDFAFIRSSKKHQTYTKDGYSCGTLFLEKNLYMSYAIRLG